MELALAVALALVLFLAFSAFMARGIERERAQRLSDELLAIRRSAPVAPAPSAPPSVDEPRRAEERAPGPAPAEVQEARGCLREALAEARRAASLTGVDAVSPEAPAVRRAADSERNLTLARTLEAVVTTLAAAPLDVDSDASPPRGVPPPVPLSTDVAAAAAGELLDEIRHVGADLHAAARQEERQREAASALTGALARAERMAAPLSTLHGTLSGLADRVNLLALNVAVLGARPGPEASVFQEAERELRAVYAELRRTGGELGGLTQRNADAVRTAREASEGITERAQASAEARTAPAERVRKAEERAGLVEQALRDLESAVRGAEERERSVARSLAAAEAESTLQRERLHHLRTEHRERTAEAARAVALAGQLAESLARAADAPGPETATPSLGPLLEKLQAADEALGRLDSAREGRTD